ncbi:DUF2232 domain-containing protein [Paenibacillus ginsengihumi]|uniref:DUF2232 domain-containing protein n=1 Tax=Paenibacillus ginsengihumi TaxID=431596 RepID=UPI000363DD54|nr:DUF2232 domain-containing protein [Paenibacillus ginsengihumi]
MLGWSIVYVFLLLSVLLPPFNLLTVSLIMVPVTVMYVKLDTKRFFLHYAASLAVVYVLSSLLFAGWVGALLMSVSLFFLPPVIQMGNLYKKRAAARSVLTIGTITLLGELLLSLVVSQLLGLQPVPRIQQFMLESMNTVPPELQAMLPVDKELLLSMMVKMLPVYMIGFSLFYVVVSHWLARKVLVRSGESIPAFKPIKDWKLPRSFVWIYLVTLLLDMFVRDITSVVFSIVWNLLPILTVAFALQAISFLFYVAYANRWNKTLPVAGIIVLLIFPPAFFLFSLLGVFDVAFPIRERLNRK